MFYFTVGVIAFFLIFIMSVIEVEKISSDLLDLFLMSTLCIFTSLVMAIFWPFVLVSFGIRQHKIGRRR